MVWTDETGTLSPLPPVARASAHAMAVLGLISTISTSLLWLHMSYRLVMWKAEDVGWGVNKRACSPEGVDLSLGLPEPAYRQAKSLPPQQQHGRSMSRAASLATNDGQRSLSTDLSNAPNPLLILIHNLILADLFLSSCYLEQFIWLGENAILVGTFYCRAQGWLISLGALSSSLFLVSMALHTYLAIIHGFKPQGRLIVLNIALVWSLSIGLTCLGPLVFIRAGGDIWGRNNLWCWIDRHYYSWRMSVLIPDLGGLTIACILYALTFWGLYKEQRSARFMPPSQRSRGSRLRPSGHHPAFLIYPFVFTMCAAPVTIGTLFEAAENNRMFMAIAGPMMALTGFLDTIIWSSTILFSDEQSIREAGLDRFALMSVSQRRALGNMVWVQGGARDAEGGGGGGHERQKPAGKGWWVLGGDVPSLRESRERFHVAEGVHVETETSVVVERESWKGGLVSSNLDMPRLKALPLRELLVSKEAAPEVARENGYSSFYRG